MNEGWELTEAELEVMTHPDFRQEELDRLRNTKGAIQQLVWATAQAQDAAEKYPDSEIRISFNMITEMLLARRVFKESLKRKKLFVFETSEGNIELANGSIIVLRLKN